MATDSQSGMTAHAETGAEPPGSRPMTRGAATGANGVSGLLDSSGGFVGGVDAPAPGNWRVGGLLSYVHSRFSADSTAASGSAENVSVGAYAGGRWGPLGLKLGAAYTWNMISTRRTVAFPGFSDQVASNYGGGTAQAFADLSYRLAFQGLSVEPFGNLAYVDQDAQSFTESGFGGAALHGDSGNMGVAFTTLGMRLAKGFTLDQHALEADAALGYRHAFGTVMPTTNENFVFGGAAFDTAGVLVPRNVALVSVGARARVTDSVKLGLGYIGQYGRGPTFLSFVIKDMSFCGGPYPSIGTMAIVYDLQTGAPVDWTQLLPPSLTWKVELTAGMDGTRMLTLASPKLYALYLAGYDQAARMPGSDIAADDLANCKEAVQGAADPPAMMVWLDAKSGGLAVQYHLAQAVQVGEFQRYYSCRRDKRRYLRC